MDWQQVEVGQWAILDEQGVILRLIVDRGVGYGGERFIASGNGHHMSEHATLEDAKAAAEASLSAT
jgi:hypothetical protein